MAELKHGPTASRSWRGGAKAATNYDGPGNATRIFWSLLFLGLMGGLTWVIVRLWPHPEAQLTAVGIVYETTTPIPFCDEDADAFAGLSPRPNVRRKDQDRSTTIVNLWEDSRRNEPVIVYLAARGVSDNGTAWLLCSDYEQVAAGAKGTPKGRYKLHDLLADAKKRQSPLKLLILDVSYALSDPAAGMMINEFPALVEAEVKNIDDKSLWVLTNSRALEVEHFCEADRRSVFGYFVTEGLRGEADVAHGEGANARLPRHDGYVDLDELYDFVLRGVGDWVEKNRGGKEGHQEGQTPCLYHATEGLVHRVPTGLRLSAVLDRVKPATADPTATAGDAAATKYSDVDEELKKVWEEHDQLDPGTISGWTIVDYAPHLWREYERIRLDYEFRVRSGRANAEVLKHLPTGGDDADRAKDTFARLQDARRQFEQNKESFAAWEKKEPSFCKAFQARNRGLRLATCGIHWRQAILACNLMRDQYADRLGHLRNLLASLQKLSPQLDAILTRSDKPGLDSAETQTLDGLADEVNKHAAALQDSWQKEASELAAKAGLPDSGRAARIEAILAIPVLKADERIALVKMRRTLDAPLVVPEKLPLREIPQSACDPSRQFITRIAEQAELEALAARLANQSASLDWQQINKATSAETLRSESERFGKQLVALQARLHDELGREAKSLSPTTRADAQTVASFDRVLRWADARDVEHLNFLPAPAVGASSASKVVVQIEPQKENPSEPVLSYKVKVRVPGGEAKEAEFSWECDKAALASALEVRTSPGGRDLLLPGAMEKIALVDNLGEVDLSVGFLKAVAMGSLNSVLKVKARAVGQAGEKAQPGEDSVNLHVPGPDALRLIVDDAVEKEKEIAAQTMRRITFDAAGREIAASSDEQKPMQLRPFPNRETAFLLQVKNESESDKELNIELVAPREWKANENWDKRLLDERLELADGIARVIDPPISLKLAAGQTLPIPFAESPPAAKSDDKSAAKPPAAAAPPAANVTNGFAVLIRDKGDKRKSWVERVEFKSWQPSDFLEANIAYNDDELEATLKAKAGAPFPAVTRESPIQIRFAANPGSELGTKVMESPSQVVHFPAKITRDIATKELRFFFDVDGYPHALQSISPDWPHQPGNIVADDTFELKITSPQPEAAFDASPKKRPVKMVLKFEVYARTDFFHPGEENMKDRIELRTFDENNRPVLPWTKEEPKIFYARQQGITLCGTGTNGELKVSTAVGKFEVPLEFNLPKQKVRIEISAYRSYTPFYYGKQRKSPIVESLPIILDEPPTIFSGSLPGTIEAGQSLPVELTVKSLSPIAQIDCGVEDSDKPDVFASEPKKVKAHYDEARETWVVTLPTEKLPPGTYKLLFGATNAVGETFAQPHPVVTVIAPPAADKPDDKKAKKGRIVGVVAFKNDPKVKCATGKVLLDDADGKAGGRSADIEDDGKFEFDDVPYGRHTLSAHGGKGGVNLKGTVEVELGDATGPQTILVH